MSDPGQLTFATRTLLVLVRVYQGARRGRPSPCRFVPSCSQYGVEALQSHGALRGSHLIIRRVLRCRPGGSHGVDLVPAVVARVGSSTHPFQGRTRRG